MKQNTEQIKAAISLADQIMKISFLNIEEGGFNGDYAKINKLAKEISDILIYKINPKP